MTRILLATTMMLWLLNVTMYAQDTADGMIKVDEQTMLVPIGDTGRYAVLKRSPDKPGLLIEEPKVIAPEVESFPPVLRSEVPSDYDGPTTVMGVNGQQVEVALDLGYVLNSANYTKTANAKGFFGKAGAGTLDTLAIIPRFAKRDVQYTFSSPGRAAGSILTHYAVIRGVQGELGNDVEKFTDWISGDEDEEDLKGFKTQSEGLQTPENDRSHKGALATRQRCEFLGQSTDKVKLEAEFNESGSSKCNIDTNPPEPSE